jgi:tRNA (guanine37-N1)-methyltransferase
MRFDVLTLFPELFVPFTETGVLGRAVKKGLVDIRLTDIRAFARGPHSVTDDRPYGGGDGMVMKAGPIVRALKSIDRPGDGSCPTILLTPQGRRFDQALAWEWAAKKQVILVCGRYEGVDERVRTGYIDLEVSIGDYILSGGETGAMVIIDAVSRLVPGVLGGEHSNRDDSFTGDLLEYPHYTRPRSFEGRDVPTVLLSGDHDRIRRWRRAESLKRTFERRPDLLEKATLSPEDRAVLREIEERHRSRAKPKD